MKLKIASYYPYLYLRSGIERTLLEILKRSRHEWTVFTNRYEAETSYEELRRFRARIIELKRISVKRSYAATLRSAYSIFMQQLPLDGFDVLWVHNEGLGSLINFKNAYIPTICFCHTPLKIIYDERLRKDYLEKNIIKAPLYFFVSYLYKKIDRKAFDFYDWCFCVSQEVKNRILKNKLFPHDRLEVVYRGVDTASSGNSQSYGNYFFHPARFKWWKNIEFSIEAFCLFQKTHKELRDFRLVIAGELYPGNDSYYQKLKQLARNNRSIEFVVNPQEAQMEDFYRHCRAVLSTTLNEDFGLTVLEGFSFAKPVVAFNRGGPAEVICHQQTGFLSSEDKNEFASYLYALANDKDAACAMGLKAREGIAKYGWDSFVNYIDAFLEKFILDARTHHS